MDGWRGNVPLPFQLSDSVHQDTDDETVQQCLNDAKGETQKGKGDGKSKIGAESGHYYRVQQILRSLIPIEWFPTIANVISEQLKQNNVGGDKKDSFAINNDDS